MIVLEFVYRKSWFLKLLMYMLHFTFLHVNLCLLFKYYHFVCNMSVWCTSYQPLASSMYSVVLQQFNLINDLKPQGYAYVINVTSCLMNIYSDWFKISSFKNHVLHTYFLSIWMYFCNNKFTNSYFIIINAFSITEL